mmetsp:Transcript_10344/g.38387  ORF Transcript_10344/g.38387 Transcript_10344/m.38387 type:complete len:326 (+) Transcript_10344:1800-2777(+)
MVGSGASSTSTASDASSTTIFPKWTFFRFPDRRASVLLFASRSFSGYFSADGFRLTPHGGAEPRGDVLSRGSSTGSSTETMPFFGVVNSTSAASASTPAATSASLILAANATKVCLFSSSSPFVFNTTSASHALTGMIRAGSTVDANAAYAAAEAALVAAKLADARASSSPTGSDSRWWRALMKTTRRTVFFLFSAFVSSCIPVSSSVSLSVCVGAISGTSGSLSVSSSSATRFDSRVSISTPSGGPFISSGGPANANFAIRLCPGSRVPCSAKSATGNNLPCCKLCVTHAGVTTGGWFLSAFFSAASLALVNRAHTMCVVVTRE